MGFADVVHKWYHSTALGNRFETLEHLYFSCLLTLNFVCVKDITQAREKMWPPED